MVFVTLSETYDLSTRKGKMSLIGIHTPTKALIQKTYPGLCINSRFVRVVSQDVVLACASMLPADPLQVGVESGKIAPQDMFNPILYKATSNDSFSTLEGRLWQIFNTENSTTQSLQSFHGSQAFIEKDNTTGQSDDFNVYYSLLSNHEGFKKAHPQQGLQMKGLKPLVFEKYYNNGENQSLTNDSSNGIQTYTNGNNPVTIAYNSKAMRGNAHPMPKFNTTYITNATGSGTGSQFNGMESYSLSNDNGKPTNSQAEMPDILPVMTGAIIMPPCALNQLFYRMTVRTTLEFTGIRPIQEVTSFAQMEAVYGNLVYHSDYDTQSAKMTTKLGMVDAVDADIEKIMEGA